REPAAWNRSGGSPQLTGTVGAGALWARDTPLPRTARTHVPTTAPPQRSLPPAKDLRPGRWLWQHGSVAARDGGLAGTAGTRMHVVAPTLAQDFFQPNSFSISRAAPRALGGGGAADRCRGEFRPRRLPAARPPAGVARTPGRRPDPDR